MVFLHWHGGDGRRCSRSRRGAFPGTQGVALAQGRLQSRLANHVAGVLFALDFEVLVGEKRVERAGGRGRRLGLSGLLPTRLGGIPDHRTRRGKTENAQRHRSGHLRRIEPLHFAGISQRLVRAAGHAVLHDLHHMMSALLAHAKHRGIAPAALAQRRRALVGAGHHRLAIIENESVQGAGSRADRHAAFGHLGRTAIAEAHFAPLAMMARRVGGTDHGAHMAAHATAAVQNDETRCVVDGQRARGTHFRTGSLSAMDAPQTRRLPKHASIGLHAFGAHYRQRSLFVKGQRPSEGAHRFVAYASVVRNAEMPPAGSHASLARRAPAAIEIECFLSHDAP